MNRRVAFALPLVLLLGCSTAPLPSEGPSPSAQFVPPPETSIELPLEPPPGRYGEVQGHFCQLGKSCMELDPRPFEACLVSGAVRCADKIQEPLLVSEPVIEEPGD
jgi:hypothetical protein